MTFRTLIALALGLILGCEAEPRAFPERGTLQVIAGRYGIAAVDAIAAEASPISPALLLGLPVHPAYTVEFSSELGRLFVLDVPGPVVDLRMVQPGEPVLWGQRRVFRVQAAPDPRGLTGVAIRDGQVVRGVPAGDGLEFTVVGSGPTDLVVVWRDGRRADAVTRRRLVDWTPEVIPSVGPVAAVDRTLVVDVAGALAGWVEVELTVDGVRTGVVLGSGLAGGRVGLQGPARGALQVARPADLGDGVGLWVHATARRVGVEAPVAEIGQHVALDTDSVTLRFPAAPDVAPAPSQSPEAAPVLSRAVPTSRWGVDDEATWISTTVDGTDGCDQQRWVVAGPASAGALAFPDAPVDVLEAPLLAVDARRVVVDGLSWQAATSAAIPEARLPQITARWGYRSARGYWRGGDAACEAEPRRGRYTAQRVGVGCAPGTQGQTVVVDRCGRVIPLAPGPLACGRLVGDAVLASDGRAAYAVEAEGDALHLIGAGVSDLRLVPQAGLAAAPAPDLSGAWFRYTLTTQRFAWSGDGLGAAQAGPRELGEGEADRGPWVDFEAGGTVRSGVPDLTFVGRLVRFDGQEGAAVIDDAGCAGEAREVQIEAEGDALVLTERVVDGDEAEVRTLTIWRR